MSELDESATASSDLSTDRSTTEHVDALIGAPREREDLPRSYRMRADAHYVDQLDARHDAPVIRLLPTRQIETVDVLSAATTPAFARSIAAHGILQPLLVRRSGARYELIAGRRRLAAALVAGIAEVPCVVHTVDAAAAAALADADNLRDAAPAPSEPVDGGAAALHDALQALERQVAEILPVAALVKPAAGLVHRAAADLVQAQAWRAAWLAGAVAMAVPPYRAADTKALAAILDRVRAGLEPEVRVSRLQLDFWVAQDAARMAFDERLGEVVCGLIFMTAGWLQHADAPRIELRADVVSPRTLKLEIVQRLVPAPEHVARSFRAADPVPMSDPIAAAALAAARAFAAQCAGTLEFVPIAHRGSVIKSVISRPVEN